MIIRSVENYPTLEQEIRKWLAFFTQTTRKNFINQLFYGFSMSGMKNGLKPNLWVSHCLQLHHDCLSIFLSFLFQFLFTSSQSCHYWFFVCMYACMHIHMLKRKKKSLIYIFIFPDGCYVCVHSSHAGSHPNT